jgi:hypothetical protein
MGHKFGHAVLLGLVLCTLLACSATAGPVWICSITRGIECLEDGTVGEPNFGELAAPTFFRVDTNKQKITLLAPESRRGEVTVIDKVLEEENMWVLTGVEDGRAWSMVISRDGYMTLSISYDGVTWSAFGHSMVEK